MTPAALRRLAAQKMADAGRLKTDADRLRTQAARIDGLLDPLVTISASVWQGPAAEDFEQCTRTRSQQLGDEAHRLRRIAGEWDDRATTLRREAASLGSQADAAEAAAVFPPASVPRGAMQ
jgi:hypothetical protein